MSRVPTTVRIDASVKDGLSKLSKLKRQSVNQLVNEALREFVGRRMAEVEIELESTLEDLRAYRRADPRFEHAIADVVEAEVATEQDPAEGRVATETGKTESAVLDLLKD